MSGSKTLLLNKMFALLKNISLFAANKAAIVEVEGPVDGGEDVGLGQDVHQHQHDQRRRQVSQGQRHRPDCNHRLLGVLIPRFWTNQPFLSWWTSVQLAIVFCSVSQPIFNFVAFTNFDLTCAWITKFLLLSVPNQINLWLNAKQGFVYLPSA